MLVTRRTILTSAKERAELSCHRKRESEADAPSRESRARGRTIARGARRDVSHPGVSPGPPGVVVTCRAYGRFLDEAATAPVSRTSPPATRELPRQSHILSPHSRDAPESDVLSTRGIRHELIFLILPELIREGRPRQVGPLVTC